MNFLKSIQENFGTKAVYRNLPFVYFLAFLGIIYIANVHYAERNMRSIQRLQVELNESRYKYMSIKAHVMYNSMPSQIAEKVADLGIEAVKEQPKRIEFKGKIE